MKRLARIIVVFMAVAGAIACSFIKLYVVINSSTAPIIVEYTVTSDVDSLEHTASKPYKITEGRWDFWLRRGSDWREVPQGDYEFDAKTRGCRLSLLPNEVVQINWEDEYRFTSEDFRISKIRLIGENGEIIYEGSRLDKQFEKNGSQDYFIRYR